MVVGHFRWQRTVSGLFLLLFAGSCTCVNAQSVIRNGGFEDAGVLVEVADPNNPGETIIVLPGVVDHNTGYEPRYVSDPPVAGDIYVLNDNSTAIGHWQVDIEDGGATIDWVHDLAVGSSQGERSVDLNGTPGPGIIWQQFRTIPGLNYVVTFDMASNPAVLGLEQVGTGTVSEYTTMLDVGIQAAPATATEYSFSPEASMSFSHSVFQGTHSISNPGWETKQWTFTASGVASALGFKSLTPEFDRDVSGLPPEEQGATELLDFGPMVDNVSVQFAGEYIHWVPLTGGMTGDCCLASDTWNVVNNWTEDPIGGARNRVPGPDDVVLIDASMFATTDSEFYTAVLNTNATVKKLIVASPEDRLSVSGSRTLEVIDGVIDNYGTIRVSNTNGLTLGGQLLPDETKSLVINNAGTFEIDAPGTATFVRLDGTVSFQGAGVLHLAGSETHDHVVGLQTDGTSRLINGPDHTIMGDGRLGTSTTWLGIVNLGVIEANSPQIAFNGRLTIDPDEVTGLVNKGVLRATGGGELLLQGGTFDNTEGGTIHAADGSFVELGTNARIVNGTITTDGTGKVITHDGQDPIFAGTIINNGQIELRSSGSDTDLRVDGAVTLAGNGSLSLVNHSTDNRIYGLQTDGSSVLTNGPAHTIAGQGQLGFDRLAIVNQGVIQGNNTNQRLIVDPDSPSGLVNTGTLRAINGGRLRLQDGTFDSTGGGTIHAADGSFVELGTNGRILGGTITTEGTGRVIVPNNLDPIVAGVITNNGQWEMTSAGSDTDLRVDGTVTLAGNGSLSLVNHSTDNRIFGLQADGSSMLINGPEHTIAGQGQLGLDRLSIVNQGVIQGSNTNQRLIVDPNDGEGLVNTGTLQAINGGRLRLQNGTFDSTGGGTIHAADGSFVELGTNGRILGGTITTEGTGRVIVPANLDPIFAGIITNNGQIELHSGGFDIDLRMDGAVTLTGNGTLTMVAHYDNHLDGLLDSAVLTNDVDHTITGQGQVFVNLVNNGTVLGNSPTVRIPLSGHVSGTGLLGNVTISGTHEPGNSTAIVPLTGAYNLTGGARLKMEIGGLTPGTEHDQLDSDGTVALGGVLDIDPFFIDDVPYLPAIDDTFTIIEADGGITGTFSNSANVITNFAGYHVKWNVLYSSNSVDVQVASITGFGIPGDFDLDGDVDSDDLDDWQSAYNSSDIGDADGDGDTDGRDFLIWQRRYGSGIAIANTSVPEPIGLALMTLGIALLVGQRRAC